MKKKFQIVLKDLFKDTGILYIIMVSGFGITAIINNWDSNHILGNFLFWPILIILTMVIVVLRGFLLELSFSTIYFIYINNKRSINHTTLYLSILILIQTIDIISLLTKGGDFEIINNHMDICQIIILILLILYKSIVLFYRYKKYQKMNILNL